MNLRSASLILLSAVALAAAVACGADAAPARTALTPISTVSVPDAIELGSVPSAAAIETARQHLAGNGDRVGAAEMPREPQARLTTLGNIDTWGSGRTAIDEEYPPPEPATLVWAVQFQGRWRTPSDGSSDGSSARTPRFGLVAVDAGTGQVLAGRLSPDPFMSPARMRSQTTFDCVTFEPAVARVTLGPQEAIQAVRGSYPAGATGKLGSEWDLDRADAEIVRCIDTVGGLDYFRFRWFVTVPSTMALHDCSTPSVRQVDLKRRCWSTLATHLVDGVTGDLIARREVEFAGPLITDQDFEDVKRFAASAGWWETWARISVYNDSLVPASALKDLISGTSSTQPPES